MYSMEPSYLINYSLWINVDGNKNDSFFSIIHNCPTSRYIISTWWYPNTLTGTEANKTYNFWEKMRYCSYYDESFLVKVWKCNQKIKWSVYIVVWNCSTSCYVYFIYLFITLFIVDGFQIYKLIYIYIYMYVCIYIYIC